MGLDQRWREVADGDPPSAFSDFEDDAVGVVEQVAPSSSKDAQIGRIFSHDAALHDESTRRERSRLEHELDVDRRVGWRR